MSDYVETLRKKAREIAKKRTTIIERLKSDNEELTKLTAAEAGIQALLRLEGEPLDEKTTQPTLFAPPPQKVGKVLILKEVLKDALSDGRPKHVRELVNEARSRGIDFGDKDPWKAVNFTLMGIKSGKTIERVDGNLWRRIG